MAACLALQAAGGLLGGGKLPCFTCYEGWKSCMGQGRDPAVGICHGGLSAEGFLFKPQAAAAAVGPRCFSFFFFFFLGS